MNYDLDKDIRRTLKLIRWMIDGQAQHGLSKTKYPSLTAEWVEENYNVNFGE